MAATGFADGANVVCLFLVGGWFEGWLWCDVGLCNEL